MDTPNARAARSELFDIARTNSPTEAARSRIAPDGKDNERRRNRGRIPMLVLCVLVALSGSAIAQTFHQIGSSGLGDLNNRNVGSMTIYDLVVYVGWVLRTHFHTCGAEVG